MTNIAAEYVDHNNDDLTVVNAARVSFDKHSEVFSKSDVGLINYLATHNHWTPFAHCRFTFKSRTGFPILIGVPEETELRQGLVFTEGLTKVRHSFFGWVQLLKAGCVHVRIKKSIEMHLISQMPVSSAAYGLTKPNAQQPLQNEVVLVDRETDERFIDHTVRETVPVFTARQRFKHTVDIDYNEVSRRYVSDAPDFFFPEAWRGAPTNGAKQGSSGELSLCKQTSLNYTVKLFNWTSEKLYNGMVRFGVAPEQARMVLPQSMMTSYYVTGSLISWKRSYGLRIDSHAQKEIRDLAVMWGEIVPEVRDYHK